MGNPSNNKPGGGQSAGFSSGTEGYQGGGNFWDFQPRPVAGLNDFMIGAGNRAQGIRQAGAGQRRSATELLNMLSGGGSGLLRQGIGTAGRYAGGALPTDFGTARGLGGELRDVASRKVTGENLGSDPALKAAQRYFSETSQRSAQNALAQAGLSDSTTSANVQGSLRNKYMLPLVQDALAREERGIGREMSGIGSQMQNLMQLGGTTLGENARLASSQMQGAGMENALSQNAAQMFAGMGEQERAALMNEMNAMSSLGTQYRGVEQEQLDAPYQEQQRLWAEALNSMYGPLGMIGSLIGGSSTSSQSKK